MAPPSLSPLVRGFLWHSQNYDSNPPKKKGCSTGFLAFRNVGIRLPHHAFCPAANYGEW